MSNRGAIGFGGFLLGLGGGYLILREYTLTVDSIAWVLIVIGGAVILSALLRWVSPGNEYHRVVGGLAGGLVFALFLTQGFNFLSGIGGVGNFNMPYAATEQKTYSGASIQDLVYLRLGTMNGGITLSTWDKDEYSIVATITARGATQKEADDNLANLGKDLAKEETASLQKLTLVYTSSILINNPYQITLDVKVPASAKIDLDITASNGGVTVGNVRGGNVVIHTSNGALRLNDVVADSLRGSTSNGPLTGTVEAATCTLSTSNGPIDLAVPSTISGVYTLSTSNGNAEVTVGSTAYYKVDATTSNADVTFSLPNLTYTRDMRTSKAATTNGYDSADLKIELNIQTSNARVTIDRSISGI
jgi:hypothetical protein